MPWADSGEAVLEEARRLTRDRIRRDRQQVTDPDLQRLLAHIEANIFDETLSLRQIRRSGEFPSAAFTALTSEFREGLKEYTVNRKREAACWLLRQTNLEMWRIARFAGYATTASFDSRFRKWAGYSPGKYRKKWQSTQKIQKKQFDEVNTNAGFWWRAVLGALDEQEIRQLFACLPRSSEPTATPESTPPAPRWRLLTRGSDLEPLVIGAVWRALRSLPLTIQREFVRHEIHCDSPALFHFLGEKSLETSREPDVQRGIQLAELALEALAGSAEELGDQFLGLQALGVARLSNAHRLASNFREAQEYIAMAESLWKDVPNKDASVEAEILALSGSLRLCQLRFAEASDLLGKAIKLCHINDKKDLLVRCLIQHAKVIGYSGNNQDAIAELCTADQILADLDDPHLRLVVKTNLAAFYALDRNTDQATGHLRDVMELAESLNEIAAIHHHDWIEGLVQKERANIDRAEDLFQKARDGFLKLNQPGYAAMASMELALLYHEEDRQPEVIRYATEVLSVFEHFKTIAGVIAPMKLLAEVRNDNEVSREILRRWRDLLLEIWRNPGVDLRQMGAKIERDT